MKWFHGSPVRHIKQFNLNNTRFDALVEGQGIYLTPTYSIARSYAGSEGSVYECEVSGAIFDATSKDEFILLIEKLNKKIDFNLFSLEYLDTTIEGLVGGFYQISDDYSSGLTWQIKNLLDNDEGFHTLENTEEIKTIITDFIADYMSQHSALKYIDKLLGLVIVCRRPDSISIVNEFEIGSDEDLQLI